MKVFVIQSQYCSESVSDATKEVVGVFRTFSDVIDGVELLAKGATIHWDGNMNCCHFDDVESDVEAKGFYILEITSHELK
ncbi:MAG: hypothetical protein FWC41_13155 [Firmicutes bacterium]|nr:hypothetical protein [Bacillota bacterium]